MKESIKKVAPMVAIGSMYAAVGIGMFCGHKFNKANNIDQREWHPITGGAYRKEKAAGHYICPPFGGKCKSFDTEEPKTSVKNRA